MKLKNKETGEIVEVESCNNVSGCISIYYEEKDGQIGTKDCYSSLAELNAEWEDVSEEPKRYWYINPEGGIGSISIDADGPEGVNASKAIDNYFESPEEAEKAVERLRAWKRLKDKGFRFQGWEDLEAIELPIKHYNNIIGFRLEDNHDVIVDLNTLFGGEE